MQNLRTLNLADLASGIRAQTLSSTAVTEYYLDRIAQHDGTLKSFVHVAQDALKQAARADQAVKKGKTLGPLHGVPIGIKDNYLTQDMPTMAGTEAPNISFARQDSAVSARLRQAGAILLGKTRTHEFAWGNVTPPTRNPWNTDYVPSGSSGGSAAAVAAGLCAAATGSDTGGSIRMPAAVCGLVGLKPTFGRVSRTGIVPHSWSLDHAGPLTRTVQDTAIMLNVMAGYDATDPACQDRPIPNYLKTLKQPIAGLTLGICRNHFFDNNQADVDLAIERAIEDLSRAGAKIIEFKIPRLEFGLAAIFAIELASSTAYHDQSLRQGRVAHFTPDVRTLVELGRFVTAPDYLKAEQLRSLLMQDFAEALKKCDAILGPTTPITAWKSGTWRVPIGDRDTSVLSASWRYTFPYNLTGLPAISIPCGFDHSGLPIGLQIAGRPFEEATVLKIAAAYERTHEWVKQYAPI
jgi:aspartyl-tRNA(Asn)/glutamyl-tRNA(Gln) amidotransferase subunit A